MSKTNHQRNFKAGRDGERYSFSPMGATGKVSSLSDKGVYASWGGDNSDGHQGHARAKSGGKKYVRSRIRAAENATTKALAQEL
jgi:hypothetical protein